ncbi:Cupredoxin, partial [Mycena latifolia]
QTMTVAVGAEMNSPGGIFQFNPNQITASNGTTITFQFSGAPGNHSVTQSSFASPCEPLAGGFDSGWIFIPTSTPPSPLPEWNLTITNDQTPIWFYCKQLLPQFHCTSGMVGVINVQPGPNDFATFQSNAQKTSGQPGQAQGGLVGIGASASAEPFIPSGVTHFLGVSATATAPSGSVSSGPAASVSTTAAPSSAVALGLNFNFIAVIGGVLAGAAMML